MKFLLFALILATTIPFAFFSCHIKGLDLRPENYNVNAIMFNL